MGKYDFQMDLGENSTTGKFAHMIVPGSTVLEFGCAEGRMTRYMQENLNCQVYIVEIDQKSFEQAKVFSAGGLCCDAETLAWQAEFEIIRFDYVMFSDVLEHLRQPDKVLKAAGELLKDDGKILVSIPNIGHGDIICSLLCNRFHYTDVGLLDSTHVHFWGHTDFFEFAANCGFFVMEEDADYLAVNESEQAAFSKSLARGIRNEIASYPYADVYEFIFTLCKREYAEGNELALVSHIRMEGLKADNLIGQLYFDTGSGYTALERMTITVNPDGCYSQRIKLPPNCRSVRFDPMEGVTGCVWDVHACTPGKSLSIQFTNGHRFGQAILFQTIDPQIEFEPLEPNSPWIELHALVRDFDGPAWVELCEQAIARERENHQLTERLECSESQRENTSKSLEVALGEVNRVEGERVALSQARDELIHERDSLAQAHKELIHERDSLAQAHKELIHERDSLAQAHKELIHERDSLAQAHKELIHERDDLTRTLSELSDQRNDLEREREQISAQRDAVREELTRVEGMRQTERQDSAREITAQQDRYIALVKQQNELTLRLSNLQESYNAISDAQLWKMTAPLRKMLDGIKRTRVGYLTHKAARHWREYGFASMVKRTREYVGVRHGAMPPVPSQSEAQAKPKGVYDLDNFLRDCEARGQVFGQEHLNGMEKRERVLLVSHEMDLTGSPIALMYFAQNLKKQGFAPILIAPVDGKLRNRACDVGIPVIVLGEVYEGSLVVKGIAIFKLIVVSTIVGAPLVSRLSSMDVPVLWWIHEAKASYHVGALNAMPEAVGENIHVYCGGEYAKKVLAQYRPAYRSDILLYTSPDFGLRTGNTGSFRLSGGKGRTIFLLIGTLEERKGQDVLVEAIRRMDWKKRERSYFVFVGRPYYKPHHQAILTLCEDYPDTVEYIEEVNQEELLSLYSSVDCVICASRDDPMPIVMADAMSLSKLIICSENSGTAPLIEQMSSGLIYRNNDAGDLARCIESVLEADVDLAQLRKLARKTYEAFFSKEAFDANFNRVMCRLLNEPEVLPGMISVVIPTYNGGTDLKRLMEALARQEGVEKIEVVVVDSGSSDHSAEYAEAAGARVIRIPQSEFSHSHARNLGAEHATGDYVLFMTQDACPNGPLWARGMLKPVLYQNVVAVSCQELPREDCDLLGRVSIFNHSTYMGILEQDRILQMPEHVDNDSLRKNGQLNDVSCLLRKDVFDRYHYRNDYAEDLDLGLRLIRDGYRLAMLSTVQVIHSHTRPSMYHFKRGIVDVSTINSVLPGSVSGKCPGQYTINRVLTAYCVIKLYVKGAGEYKLTGEGDPAWKEFCKWKHKRIDDALRQVKDMGARKRKELIARNDPLFDSNYRKVMLEMLDISGGAFDIEPTTVNEMRYYLISVLGNYFIFNRVNFTEAVKKEICVLAEKLTGLFGGNLVGTYAALPENAGDKLDGLVRVYRQGV